MKYSQDTQVHRDANIQYANERWRQLYDVQSEWATEGIKYLMLVNSGGAAAMLTFLGTVASARDLVWPKVILASFALGVLLIGFMHVLRHHHISQLFKKWREAVNEYFTDQKDWEQIIKEDTDRSNRFDWALMLAYLSFACFIMGIVVGIANFNDLTSGGDHGKQDTKAATSTTQTIRTEAPISQTRPTTDSGRDATHAATATRPEKEMKTR